MSKYVNRVDVKEFVKGEIKEISERWARSSISIMGLEKWIKESTPTDVQKTSYDIIMKQIEGKKSKQIDYFLQNLKVKHPKQVEDFELVNEFNKREEELDTIKKDRVSLEEFLEITDNFLTKFNDENK